MSQAVTLSELVQSWEDGSFAGDFASFTAAIWPLTINGVKICPNRPWSDDYRKWVDRAMVYEKDQPFSAVISVPMIWPRCFLP